MAGDSYPANIVSVDDMRRLMAARNYVEKFHPLLNKLPPDHVWRHTRGKKSQVTPTDQLR